MSYKKVSYSVLILIMLLGITYFVSINSSTSLIDSNSNEIGPEYFPNLLSVLLIFFCVIGMVQTARKEDKKIEIPYIKTILITIILTGLFFISWNLFGWFYIQSTIYLTVLFTIYRYEPDKIRSIAATSALLSLIVMVFIYGVFGYLMSIPF